MKKIITAVTALIAMSVAFMSCGFTDGAAAPDYGYKEFSMDLSSYELDSSKAGSFSISGNELVSAGMREGSKIILTYKNIATKTPGLKIYFNNEYDDAGTKKDDWRVYHELDNGNKKYYDIEENLLSADEWGVVRGKEGENSIVLKPNKADIESFTKRGLVIQGTDSIVTSIKMMYLGTEVVVTDIKDFSKELSGTLTSKVSEVKLDKEDANISVLEVIPNVSIGTSLEYKFTGAADLSKYSNMVITLKTPYKTLSGAEGEPVVKKSTFKDGLDYTTNIVYNFYAVKVSDGTKKSSEDNSTIPDGAIYLEGDEGKMIVPVYIQMICPEYKGSESGKDFAYVNSSDTKGNLGDADISKLYKYTGIKGYESWGGWNNQWCCRYVYTEKVDSDVVEKRATAQIKGVPFVTINKKDYRITETLAYPEFTEISVPLKDFEKLESVTGYTIDLNQCEGTVFIKSIIFE